MIHNQDSQTISNDDKLFFPILETPNALSFSAANALMPYFPSWRGRDRSSGLSAPILGFDLRNALVMTKPSLKEKALFKILIKERSFCQNGYAVHSVRQIIELILAKIHVLHIFVDIRPSTRCSTQRCNISGRRLADPIV